jgi:pimeloyl-ACP methyl ester carboxylesterase
MREPEAGHEVAGWFPSSEHQLFSWLHLPEGRTAKAGVVICSPLLIEYYAAHATLRRLAVELAERGVAAMRFDYRGMGDSTGHPEELGDISCWVDDITAGVRRLRESGVDFVAVVGMRIGANLVASDANACGADAVVLWDPFASGRAFIRHSTFFQRSAIEIEAGKSKPPERSSPDSDPEQLSGSMGSAPLGFAFPDSFLESFQNLGSPSTTSRPTLVLTRPGRSLRTTGASDAAGVEIAVAEGQRELLETELHNATIPESALTHVRDWLCSLAETRPSNVVRPFLRPTLEVDGDDGRFREQVMRIGDVGGLGLFAIRTDPWSSPLSSPSDLDRVGPSDLDSDSLTVLFFNSGMQHHVGPNRLYVDLSRRLVSDGISSIRLDFSGLGDSPARPPHRPALVYSPGILDDIEEVMKHTGTGPKAVVGLCSGGYHALEAGYRHSLRGVLAIHSPLIMWHMPKEPAFISPDRAIWVPDRPWLVAAERFWLGRAITWRIPGRGWWLLDRLGIQTDVSAGVRRSIVNGANVVMIAENGYLKRTRAWPMTHQRRGVPKVIKSDADHSLLDATGRATVTAQALEVVTGWVDHSPTTVPTLAPVHA